MPQQTIKFLLFSHFHSHWRHLATPCHARICFLTLPSIVNYVISHDVLFFTMRFCFGIYITHFLLLWLLKTANCGITEGLKLGGGFIENWVYNRNGAVSFVNFRFDIYQRKSKFSRTHVQLAQIVIGQILQLSNIQRLHTELDSVNVFIGFDIFSKLPSLFSDGHCCGIILFFQNL